MTSILTGTATVAHRSSVPASAARAAVVAMLHDHEFFISCDPHMIKFVPLTPDAAPVLPDSVKATAPTKSYTVTDKVAALPAGLWDSDVVSTYEFTDVAEGVFVRIKSPLSVMMETLWTVQGEDGKLEMVEEVTITCNKLIVSVVKSQCEGNWKAIHAKMLAKLG